MGGVSCNFGLWKLELGWCIGFPDSGVLRGTHGLGSGEDVGGSARGVWFFELACFSRMFWEGLRGLQIFQSLVVQVRALGIVEGSERGVSLRYFGTSWMC